MTNGVGTERKTGDYGESEASRKAGEFLMAFRILAGRGA